MSQKRERRTYTEEFKKQIVNLYLNGKARNELIKDYDLTPSALAKWITYYNATGSFKEADNLTEDQKKIKELKKQLKQAMMENDILKQAALIMGRK